MKLCFILKLINGYNKWKERCPIKRIDYVLTEENKRTVEENLGLVPYIVNKYFVSKMNKDYDFDDLVDVGYYGLCKASILYNPDSGIAFSTYASQAIIRNIKRELNFGLRKKRGAGRITVSLNDIAIRKDEVEGTFEDKLYNIPDDYDIEYDVLNRIACEPIWECVPTYCAIEASGMNEREYAKSIGLTNRAVNWRKRNEFAKVRAKIIREKIWEGISA